MLIFMQYLGKKMISKSNSNSNINLYEKER